MLDAAKPARGRPTLVAANLAAFVLLILSGLVHGRLTDRWGTSDALADAVDRLHRVPLSIGDWHGQDVAMDRRQIERAGIQGHLSRVYRNARDGRELTMLLVCGRPGPIAVHTPDVCYKGAGYEAESEPVAEDLGVADGGHAWFLGACFDKVGAAVPERLDIRWAWNARGAWEVPSNPRVAFATYPSLYKLYMIARRDGTTPPTLGRPAADGKSALAILEAIDRALIVKEGPLRGSRDEARPSR